MDMEAQISAYQDEEEKMNSAFVDTWDQEEENGINVQVFNYNSQPPEKDLQSASRFIEKQYTQNRIDSDSINPDLSADLIHDGT